MMKFQALLLFLLLPIALHAETVVVTTTADEDDGVLDPKRGAGTSLREAVSYADFDDRIVFDRSLSGLEIVLDGTPLEPRGSLEIDGTSLSERITISADRRCRIFTIDAAYSLTLRSLILSHGAALEEIPSLGAVGGAVFTSGSILLEGCLFQKNQARYAGAIWCDGTARIVNCDFLANSAVEGDGGAVSVLGDLSVEACRFTANSSESMGGAIISNGPMVVRGSKFHKNSAKYGGAIRGYNADDDGGTVEISTSSFIENSADESGGAIRCRGLLNATDLIFFKNTAGSTDGAIMMEGDLEIQSSEFIQNSAAAHAGALGLSRSASSEIVSCSFDRNVAGGQGGAIQADGETTIERCTFTSNQGVGRGGAIVNGGGLIVRECTFESNSVDDEGDGGAIYNSETLEVEASVFDGNSAEFGGALYSRGSDTAVLVTLCEFTGNSAYDAGGAIANNDGVVTISGSTFTGNTADEGGGIANQVIDNTGGTLVIEGSTLDSNSAARGAAIWNAGELAAENTTVAENVAAEVGGGLYNSGDADLRHVTISKNMGIRGGGGIYSNASSGLTLHSTIVGSNLRLTFEEDADLAASSWDGRNNLIGDDPLLAELGDYGGPTQTMPPLIGSPVIDASVLTSETPATDQIGHDRPLRGAPEIGAVEFFRFWRSVPSIDLDLDGIADVLEPSLGFAVEAGSEDGVRDDDGDGVSNQYELMAMTDPFDSGSRLRITGCELVGRDAESGARVMHVTWEAQPGVAYQLERSTTLAPGSWEVCAGPLAAMAGSADVQLRPERDFVRVVVVE